MYFTPRKLVLENCLMLEGTTDTANFRIYENQDDDGTWFLLEVDAIPSHWFFNENYYMDSDEVSYLHDEISRVVKLLPVTGAISPHFSKRAMKSLDEPPSNGLHLAEPG